MKYTAGWNAPGFLPEADVFETGGWEEAVSYIKDAAKRFLDEDLQAAVNTEDEEDGDQKWQRLISELGSMLECYTCREKKLEFQLYNTDYSLVFWVSQTINPESLSGEVRK